MRSLPTRTLAALAVALLLPTAALAITVIVNDRPAECGHDSDEVE